MSYCNLSIIQQKMRIDVYKKENKKEKIGWKIGKTNKM